MAAAPEHHTAFGDLRVASLEGLIGFKLQGLVNDPRRTQDLEDIRALLRANRDTVNLPEVREYFRLFDRKGCSMNSSTTLPKTEPPLSPQPIGGGAHIPTAPISERDPFEQLDDLMVVVESLCPTWPPRGHFGETGRSRL